MTEEQEAILLSRLAGLFYHTGDVNKALAYFRKAKLLRDKVRS